MQSYWKKMIVAVVAVFAVTTAFAAKKEEPAKPFHNQGQAKGENQMMAGYNAPARVDTHGYDFSIWGSFIYWQPIQENMHLGYYMEGWPPEYVETRTYFKLDFNWKPGFKVGIGASTDYDHWDFTAEYTWLHGNDKKGHDVDPTKKIIIPRYNQTHMTWRDGGVTRIWGEWEMDFDILDAEMARSYYVGTKLSLRTHFGIRAAWLNQEFNEKFYEMYHVYDSYPVPAHWWYYKGKTNNWGVGPRIGLDIHWLFDEGFYFLGKAATSILYSKYKVSEKETNVWRGPPDNFLYNEGQRDKFYELRPTLEIISGLGWNTYFGDGEYHFDLSAAYEFHMLWNQEAMRSNTDRGDLYLNGLTVTARFDF